jgi:hypothetical protein
VAVEIDGAQLIATGPDTMVAAIALPGGRARIVTRDSALVRGYWKKPPAGIEPMAGLPDNLEQQLQDAEERVPRLK